MTEVRLLLPTVLKQYADNISEFGLEAGTVGDALRLLVTKYPALRGQLFADGDRLRNFVNVYLNDEDVRFSEGEETRLKPGDVIMIVPAVAGGTPALVGAAPFTQGELARYSRHLIMPEVGMEGQKRLRSSSVLVVGAGGLGAPAAVYLAAAGVGRIGIADFDRVERSNLHRQILYSESDIGRSKVEVAKERLLGVNPNVDIRIHTDRLDSSNALKVLADYDLVLDGTDNFPTRYLVNDACFLLGKPNVYASIFRFEGQLSVFNARDGPCYRCLYPEPPPPGLVPSCAEGGVLGVLPGIVGSMQAAEAIALLLRKGRPLVGRLLLLNALDMTFKELKVRKDARCPLCGPNPTVKQLVDYEAFCRAGEKEELGRELEVDATTLKGWLDSHRSVSILDVRESFEYEICRLDGSKLIPLGELPERVNEISTSDLVVVYCASGARSARAVKMLRELGYAKVKNLKGGIRAWAEEVDPSLEVY